MSQVSPEEFVSSNSSDCMDDGRFLEIGPLSYGVGAKARPSYLEATGAEQSG